MDALRHLRHCKHEVLLFHTLHHGQELNFDYPDRPTEFIDLESGRHIKLRPSDIAQHYRQNITQQTENLKRHAIQYRIDYQPIDVGKGFVRVVGKGDKERLVPIGTPALDARDAWLEVRPLPAAPEFSDYAFLNLRGKLLSRVSVFKMVKERAMLAGVRKEISPHTFRHSFATHMVENGADLRVVQEMLGHESILTTEIYTHIDSQTWQKSILEHHPRR